jgi:hypothetical protein
MAVLKNRKAAMTLMMAAHVDYYPRCSLYRHDVVDDDPPLAEIRSSIHCQSTLMAPTIESIEQTLLNQNGCQQISTQRLVAMAFE